MRCAKCNDTGVVRCPFDGETQDCPCVWTARDTHPEGERLTETEGARLEDLPPLDMDPTDRAVLDMDAAYGRYRTAKWPPEYMSLAVIAHASVAATKLLERLVWLVGQPPDDEGREENPAKEVA